MQADPGASSQRHRPQVLTPAKALRGLAALAALALACLPLEPHVTERLARALGARIPPADLSGVRGIDCILVLGGRPTIVRLSASIAPEP